MLGRGWESEPDEVGGPRDWPHLHYVCHSCFASVELARQLLERGADPNAYFANEHGPMSVLFGAAGVLHDPELTAVLLEHGADPNGEPQFGDALYHSVESEDIACLRLLLEHGAEPWGSNALGHALDYERLEHMRLLLEAGRRSTDVTSFTRSGAAAAWSTFACSRSEERTSITAAGNGRRPQSSIGPPTRTR